MSTAAPTGWSYFNVLEAILGACDPGDYVADVGRWTEEVLHLRERYEGRYPELFRELHFVARPRRRPYSRQVSDFFVHQAVGGVKQAINPSYERMILSQEALDELRQRNEALVTRYREVLNEMARTVVSALRLTAEQGTRDDHGESPRS